jgi:arylsulfatase A
LELYNLKEDISEKNNLADKMPEKTTELRKLLDDFLESAQTIMHRPNPDYKNAQ